MATQGTSASPLTSGLPFPILGASEKAGVYRLTYRMKHMKLLFHIAGALFHPGVILANRAEKAGGERGREGKGEGERGGGKEKRVFINDY